MAAHQLFAAGSNAQGQLGIGTIEDAHTFQRCRFLREDGQFSDLPAEVEILSLSAGAKHTLLLVSAPSNTDRTRRTNELWACGLVHEGLLGLQGRLVNTLAFKRLEVHVTLEALGLIGYQLSMIAVSWESTFIVLSNPGRDDVVVSMGSNDYGMLGTGVAQGKSHGPRIVPIISALPNTPRQAGTVRVIQIACSVHHVMAILQFRAQDRQQRVVIGWGAGRHGQLGTDLPVVGSTKFGCQLTPGMVSIDSNPLGLIQPEQLALGQRHSVVRLTGGTIIGCGSNGKEQLESLENVNNATHIGCTWNGTYALPSNEQARFLWATGSYDRGQLGREQESLPQRGESSKLVALPPNLRVVDLAFGSEHVLVLGCSEESSLTEVWAWGWNEHGNLGLGHAHDVHIPIRAWPSPAAEYEFEGLPERVWAGCGTTWILVRSVIEANEGAVDRPTRLVVDCEHEGQTLSESLNV